jgi:hypothetical protein
LFCDGEQRLTDQLLFINPRSLGGGDEPENLIALTAGDHLRAHILLAKIYGGKQWAAVLYITGSRRSRIPTKLQIKSAAIARVELSKAFSGEGNQRFGLPGYFAGKTLSPEHKRRISEAHLGKIVPDSAREKMSKARKGRKLSENQKALISSQFKDKPLSEQHREKISEALKGRTLSKETREKLSRRARGRKHSAEARAKMSALRRAHPENNPMKDPKIVARFMGGSHPRARKVRCIETGELFNTLKAAKKQYGISSLSPALRDSHRVAGGYHWEYA